MDCICYLVIYWMLCILCLACRKQENLSYIVMGVVIGILVVGLTLVCTWKAFVTLHDRREYARFEEEKRQATFSSVCYIIHDIQEFSQYYLYYILCKISGLQRNFLT